MALAFVLAVICAASAHAAYYKTLYCGAADGSGNPTLGARPGFFDFTDDCGTAYGDPAGTGGFLRLEENTTGTAGNTDEASYSWWAPPGTSIAAVSAYTRVPGYFNSGWRERFWAEGLDGSENNILMQGSGVANEGINAPATSNFNYHAWPFGSFGDYKRLVFAMTCCRPAGCSREGWNATDTNSIAITLDDKEDPHVNWEGDSHVLAGDWVKGNNPIEWRESDVGSGLRFSRLKADGAVLGDGTIDYQANGGCRTGSSDANGEFARDFQPCTPGPYVRYYGLRTEELSDGAHQLQVCVQDYSQYQHIGGSASETCDTRTIHTDNSAPGKPAELKVTSTNPARYLDHFGASFSLPPDPGSPIAKVHYEVLDSTGKVVEPEKTLSATNPTSLSGIEDPKAPGAYRLKLWLEDSVGFTGPAAEAPIPHDTTPPAAPQGLRVSGSPAHWVEKLDLRWQDIADEGSPIDEAHYQLLDASEDVIGASHTVSSEGVHAIDGIDSPAQRCACEVRVWLTDEEGNTGAPASVALPRDTTPPAAPQDLSVTAPSTSRAADGFDVHWRDIADEGSAIDAAHYRIVNDSGSVVVPATTAKGDHIERIADLDTPSARGGYTLVLWLSDAEGNTGAPVKAPLVYNCVKADDAGGSTLTAGIGERQTNVALLHQGQGTTLRGNLAGGPDGNVPVCVFSQVVTNDEREFVGVALTNPNGDYRFSIPAGPSRELTAVYRPGQRELSAQASIRTKVRPGFRLVRKVVRNKGFATFKTAIPGPQKKNVVILLQVKSGKAWRVFRRCHTRTSGRCLLRYRFTQTPSPTVYIMRAQVRAQSGYPYQQGSSKARRLRVVPSTSRARKALRGPTVSRARPARP